MLENVAGEFVAKRRSHKRTSDADRARAKEYREKNKAETIERNRVWREQNKEYVRAYSRARYEKFKAQWARRSQENHKENPAAILFTSAKARAKKYGVVFTIMREDIIV